MKTKLSIIVFLCVAAAAVADVADDVRCTEISFSQSVENHDVTAFTSSGANRLTIRGKSFSTPAMRPPMRRLKVFRRCSIRKLTACDYGGRYSKRQ